MLLANCETPSSILFSLSCKLLHEASFSFNDLLRQSHDTTNSKCPSSSGVTCNESHGYCVYNRCKQDMNDQAISFRSVMFLQPFHFILLCSLVPFLCLLFPVSPFPFYKHVLYIRHVQHLNVYTISQ